jgi:putative acetyltransferase
VGWVPLPGGDGDNDVELRSLYVRASHRRRGYAAALVGLVDRVARSRGAAAVGLWSDSRFIDAHRLYTRLGFVRQPGERHLDDPSESVELPFRRQVAR